MAETTYRNYLQSQANSGNLLAGALLQVAGDDINTANKGLDQTFLSNGVNIGYDGQVFDKNQVISGNDNLIHEYQNFLTTDYTQPTSSGGTVLGTTSPTGTAYYNTGVYDTTISNLNALKRALGNQQTAARTNIDELYGTSRSNLGSARDQSLRTLENVSEQNDANRVRSLRDLQQGIRGSMQGFNNQLGALGAGSSSAADLGGFAFSKLGAQGTTDINESFGQNATQIGLRQQDVESEFGRQLAELDTWKNNNIRNIVQEYDALRLDLQNQINLTEAEKAAAASTITQQAVNQLNQLDDAYVQTGNQLQQEYQALVQPSVNTGNLAVRDVAPLQIANYNPANAQPRLQAAGVGGLQQAGGFSLQGSRRDDFRL